MTENDSGILSALKQMNTVQNTMFFAIADALHNEGICERAKLAELLSFYFFRLEDQHRGALADSMVKSLARALTAKPQAMSDAIQAMKERKGE